MKAVPLPYSFLLYVSSRRWFMSLLIALVLATSARGGELPEAPTSSSKSLQALTPAPAAGVRLREHNWTADILLVEGVKWAAMIADIETTAAGVKAGRCQEGNPIWGKRPSRFRMYATLGGLGAFHTWAAWRSRRHGHSKQYSLITGSLVAGLHSLAAGLNGKCL